MFRRIAFNVVVRNQDDHTKNISFLMDSSGQWSLSPAYDMGFAYNPLGAWTATHQMSINGKFDNITRADLLSLANANNIKNASKSALENRYKNITHQTFLEKCMHYKNIALQKCKHSLIRI